MKLLIAVVALAASLSAVAQSKHMVSFGTSNQTLGSLAWNSEKSRGSDAEEDKSIFLMGNYAYSLNDHIQVGGNLNYTSFKFSTDNSESYGFQVGGYYNLNSDFRKSMYASVFAGWDWGYDNSKFSDVSRTETFKTTVAVGHRYPLSFLNLENVTYSPEIAFVSNNSTKKSDTEWSQSLEFRLIQFAVFF